MCCVGVAAAAVVVVVVGVVISVVCSRARVYPLGTSEYDVLRYVKSRGAHTAPPADRNTGGGT